MKTFRFLLFILLTQIFATSLYAKTNYMQFMTPRDLLNNEVSSKINLQNNKNIPATIYGLYVRQYSYVTPGDSCSKSTVIYPATNNIAAGSVVMPITLGAGKSTAIGSNYLYNMIYEAIYYENIIIPSSPPGCALPGCTWGSDNTKYNWCIFLGALAPVTTTSSYTSNVPPSTDAPSSAGNYNYDLINNYVLLGPISCDDQTLTCTMATQQTHSFS